MEKLTIKEVKKLHKDGKLWLITAGFVSMHTDNEFLKAFEKNVKHFGDRDLKPTTNNDFSGSKNVKIDNYIMSYKIFNDDVKSSFIVYKIK